MTSATRLAAFPGNADIVNITNRTEGNSQSEKRVFIRSFCTCLPMLGSSNHVGLHGIS